MKTKTVFRNLLIAVMFCIAFSMKASAQNNVNDANITMDSISPGTYAGTYVVVLNDSTFNQIEIKLGTNANGSELLSYTYDYDVTTGLPALWTYSRSGNIVTLGVGTYTEKDLYFGTVRVKSGATWSDPYYFISN